MITDNKIVSGWKTSKHIQQLRDKNDVEHIKLHFHKLVLDRVGQWHWPMDANYKDNSKQLMQDHVRRAIKGYYSECGLTQHQWDA